MPSKSYAGNVRRYEEYDAYRSSLAQLPGETLKTFEMKLPFSSSKRRAIQEGVFVEGYLTSFSNHLLTISQFTIFQKPSTNLALSFL